MSISGRLFSVVYDRAMARTEAEGLADHRRKLLAEAVGDVVEIGGGTGANFAHYDAGVTTLTVTDPEKAMMRRLQGRADTAAVRPRMLRAPAEDLPFDDASFDVAVSTLVLCTVD